jgi:preprotein translocase subunit SecG
LNCIRLINPTTEFQSQPHHRTVSVDSNPSEGIIEFMIILITIVHVAVCFFLIVVVLLQSGKSGDVAAAFGGMGSQTAFGPRGAATVLSRATTWSAIIFMVTSITLSVVASRRSVTNSVLQGVKASPVKSQPAKPAAPPASTPQK